MSEVEGCSTCSGTDAPGPRLSRLNAMDILESTDMMLHPENSPLLGLSAKNEQTIVSVKGKRFTSVSQASIPVPSDGWVLFVGVPIEPLIVQRSVGENSGSLIGPLGIKGVKIVEGDCSIPRLWRYN